MRSALLGIWLLLLFVTIAFAQYGGGYTTTGGGSGTVTGGTGCNTVGSSLLKGSGTGGCSNAVAGTDYAPPTSGTSILKGNGTGGTNPAVAGTDYQAAIPAATPTPSNFLTGFSAGAFTRARPNSTDLGDLPIPLGSGGTGATTAAGAAAVIGALEINNNLSEIATAGGSAQTAAQNNLGLGALAALPIPVDAAHGGLNTNAQPVSGQIPIGNPAGSGYAPQTLTGDASVTSTGAVTIGSTHISGASPSALAQFNSVGNIVPFAGSATLPANNFATGLSASGGLTGQQVSCGGLTGAPAHCGSNGSEITSGTVPAAAGGAGVINGILKANGSGVVSAANPSVDYAPATTGAVGIPLFNSGGGGFVNGTVSGNTTEVATFSGPSTSARCLHTDASGNITIFSTDCQPGTGGVPGYINTPAVSSSGGNSTVNLTSQCSFAGCTDYNNVANGTNVGTMTMSPPVPTTNGTLFLIYVKDGATAPTDVLFGTVGGVTYQSYVIGLSAADLTSTAAGEAAKRAAICGTPTANATLAYQFWWDGANLNLTGCSSSASAQFLSVAAGGTSCGLAGPMATTLPAVPVLGARCMVNNASACIAGAALNTTVTGSTPCEVVWSGTNWQPAGGAIAPATAGFTTTGLGLTSNGNAVALATPVAATNGGAGTVSGILKANGSGLVSAAVANTDYQGLIPSATPSPTLYLTGFTAPSTFTTRRPVSTDLGDLPIPPLSGGSGCGQTNTLKFSQLPASPVFGTSCFITDCATGVAGTPEVGGGSISCSVANMSTTGTPNWVDGGLATAAPGSGNGVNIQLNNATSGGTVINRLASVNSSNQAVITPLGATSGVQGVCISGCGNSGTATIQTQGSVPCQFDGGAGSGSVTPGHYAAVNQSPGTVLGECYDAGTTPPGGIALVGTIISPTATCTGASCGLFNVNLFGPDVTGVAGSAAINTGVIGNGAIYGGTNTVAPMPGTFHISTNSTDAIFKILTTNGKCMSGTTPVACDIIVDPGVVDTETGPDLVGYTNCGSNCPPEQRLILDNSKVTFSGGNPTGSYPGPFPQDDGLVLGPNGSLQCMGNGNGTGGITDSTGAHLNSIVTTLGGVILNPWRASTNMARGEFIFDGTNVQRILSCTGTCTTGSTVPSTWNGTRYGTTTDNQVTWQDINPAGRFTLLSTNADINGCFVYGNQLAQTNNDLRISGIGGAMAVARNIAGIGVGTGTGSDDTTGSDAILFDQPQGDGFCTGPSAPLACCSGPQAGNCDNSSAVLNNGSLLTIQGLWSQPLGTITSPNPGYLVRFTGNGTGFVDIEGGQISDLGSSAASPKLVADMSIDGSVRHVTFNNYYFESNSSAGHVPPDQVVINGGTDINFTGVYLGGTGPNLTNALHILGASQGIYFRGSIAANGIVNAIKNDINGFILPPPVGIAQPVTYQYGTAAGSLGWISDGQPETFNNGIEFTKQTAPGAPGATSCVLYAVHNASGGCDIAAKCGTSATATTIATNVGSGC